MDFKEHGHEHEPRDGPLLPYHEDSEEEEKVPDEGRKSFKSALFVVLATTSTLAARRVLRDGFPYPFYFIFTIQFTAYIAIALVVLLVKLKNFRKPKRKPEGEKGLSFGQKCVVGCRLGVSGGLAAGGMLCGARVVMLYENLCVLAMLPILTYVCDSLLSRFLHICKISRQANVDMLWGSFWKVALVPLCLAVIVYEDYRVDGEALSYALMSFYLVSLAKNISKVGPKYERGPTTWDTPFYIILLIGIPFLAITGYATAKYEDMVAAAHLTSQWGLWRRLMNIGPGVALHILFSSSVNSAYPFLSQDLAGGALEDPSIPGKEAVRSTLHTGFWIILIGVYGKEQDLIDWYQTIAFTIIYVSCVGPRHIGYYPPRFLNLISRLFRRKPLPMHPEPWQFMLVLPLTTIIFAVLMSTNSIYWVDTVAYNRALKSWPGPSNLNVDAMYRPPELHSFDIIIAHSPGDPLESITNLIATYTSIPAVAGFGPRVFVYTKDAALNATLPGQVRGLFTGEVTIQTLRNSGGVPATYLHHILYAWEFISQQTLFLSTASNTPLLDAATRMHTYFQPAGFPLPDAVPKTGFLNLGQQETCWCGDCKDSTGWEDSFHLVASMWAAARPGAATCDSVLLTRGNEFVASSARIRGVKRDVWQMLYDALTREDVANAWSHDRGKIPQMLEGQKSMGRWADDGVYGVEDSLEEPVFALTVERLWAVLLQCSVPEIAWRCPSLGRGWRRGGERQDCACID